MVENFGHAWVQEAKTVWNTINSKFLLFSLNWAFKDHPDLHHKMKLSFVMPDHNILNTEEPFLRLEKKSEFLHLIFYSYIISFCSISFCFGSLCSMAPKCKNKLPSGSFVFASKVFFNAIFWLNNFVMFFFLPFGS